MSFMSAYASLIDLDLFFTIFVALIRRVPFVKALIIAVVVYVVTTILIKVFSSQQVQSEL